MSVPNADLIPALSDQDLELELMLLDEKRQLEPWEKTQRARLLLEQKNRSEPQKKKRATATRRQARLATAEVQSICAELLAADPNPELEALLRKHNLLV